MLCLQSLGVLKYIIAGIRVDIERLAAGEFDSNLPGKAALIMEVLDLWRETVILGDQLVSELREVERGGFIGRAAQPASAPAADPPRTAWHRVLRALGHIR